MSSSEELHFLRFMHGDIPTLSNSERRGFIRERSEREFPTALGACPVGAITIVAGSFVKANVSEASLRSAVKIAKERLASGTLTDFGRKNAERAVEECSVLLEGFVLRP